MESKERKIRTRKEIIKKKERKREQFARVIFPHFSGKKWCKPRGIGRANIPSIQPCSALCYILEEGEREGRARKNIKRYER